MCENGAAVVKEHRIDSQATSGSDGSANLPPPDWYRVLRAAFAVSTPDFLGAHWRTAPLRLTLRGRIRCGEVGPRASHNFSRDNARQELGSWGNCNAEGNPPSFQEKTSCKAKICLEETGGLSGAGLDLG